MKRNKPSGWEEQLKEILSRSRSENVVYQYKQIESLISQELHGLLKKVEEEVIGKNEDWRRFINNDNQMRAIGRNRLKSRQRQLLNKLKEKI